VRINILLTFFFISIKALGQADTLKPYMHPGISSALLHKGHFEIRSTGSLGIFYDNSSFSGDQAIYAQNQEIKSFSSSSFYGLTKWLNIGVVYQFMHFQATYQNLKSPFTSRYNTNNIGPQVRIGLIRHTKTECYVQTYILFPMDKYVSSNKVTYASQLITTSRIGYNWVFSFQLAAYIYPKNITERHPITIPVSLFAGYLVKNRFIPFLMANYNSDLGSIPTLENDRYYQLNYALYTGIGAKYQIFRNFDIAAYYSYAIKSKNGDKFNSISASVLMLF